MKRFASLRTLPLGVCSLLATFLAVLAEEFTVRPLTIEADRVVLRLTTGQAGTYLLQRSIDLENWADVQELDLSSDGTEFTDFTPAQSALFYRILTAGGGPGSVTLLPDSADMLEGDTVLLRVIESDAEGTAWVYLVEGVEGGNAVHGTIVPLAGHPGYALYTAPTGLGVKTVTVTAVDPDDSQRRVEGSLTIRPIPGELTIRPANALVPLGGTVQFQAGADIPDVGFLPFHRVYWKVNGTLGGDPDNGIVTADGIYAAPAKFAATQPQPISVGFSMTPEQAPVLSAPVTLAKLDLSPAHLILKGDEQGRFLTASLVKSDGTSQPVPAGDLDFESNLPEAAEADATGEILVGDGFGAAVITATHRNLGLEDTSVVESRGFIIFDDPDARTLTSLDLHPLVEGFPPFTFFRGFEVTEPGAFKLIPQAFKSKFGGFQFGADNPTVDLTNSDALRFASDDPDLIVYGEHRVVPSLEGAVAVIEERSGILQIGDTPGTAQVKVIYDDGVCQSQQFIDVVFSRLDIDVSLQGSVTQDPALAYTTEWLDLEITLTNPNPQSDFIGRTTLAVELADGNPFLVSWEKDLQTNTGNPPKPIKGDSLQEGGLAETRRFVVDATDETLPVVTHHTHRGKIRLRIGILEPGNLTFRISQVDDPGNPVREASIEVRRPTLEIADGGESEFFRNLPGHAGTPESSVVVNSYVDFTVSEGQPSPHDFVLDVNAFGQGVVLRENDSLAWTVVDPNGMTTRIPVVEKARFPGHLRIPGTYQITLGYEGLQHIRTATLDVPVVEPSAVAGTDREQVEQDGWVVQPEDQFGAVKILSPVAGSWLPGEPMDLIIQTYNALGQPRPIGKTTQTVSTVGGSTTTDESHQVIGLRFYRMTGADFEVVGDPWPDANGIISLQLVPTNSRTEDKDIVAVMVPTIFQPSEFTGLPIERIEYQDGVEVSRTRQHFGLARFTHEKDFAYVRQCLMVPGRGLVVSPRQLPVATQRLRDASGNSLPAGAEHVTFTIRGTPGFGPALASGAPTIDLGEGMQVVSQSVQGDGLTVTASTDLAYFAADPQNRYGPRRITAQFAQEVNRWEGEIDLFSVSLLPLTAGVFENRIPVPGTDANLPLNGRHGFFNPGTVPYSARLETGSALSLLDVELRPSVHAVWDVNQNGIAEQSEDVNGDGFFTSADAPQQNPGLPFRGALVPNPLVGFERSRLEGGRLSIRRFKQQLRASGVGFQFVVFGNTGDDRTLNPVTNLLGAPGASDELPDFVSRTTGGESLLAGVGGNYADVVTFTAYNITTRPELNEPETVGPALDFDALRQMPITHVYEEYSGHNPDITINALAAAGVLNPTFAVWVDHEAPSWSLQTDSGFLRDGIVPLGYYGGMLDQYYLRRTKGGGFGNVTSLVPIGQDNRVRAFRDPSTGAVRYPFGLQLDGVLYDPTFAGIDSAPNSARLTNIPVVAKHLLRHGWLTDDNLIPAAGGTSGGYFEPNPHAPGASRAISATPGASVPGLHAGYLLHGKPSQLLDPVLGTEEDDIRDVLVKRTGTPATVAGKKIDEERRGFGLQPRRVMVYGANEDKKGPIRTGAQTSFEFHITTDPPLPAGESVKFKSIVILRERESEAGHVDLTVTSQSEGNEKTLKIVADAAVDFTVDLIASAILSSVTSGSYLAACGGVDGASVVSALTDLGIGLMESEYMQSHYDTGTLTPTVLKYGNKFLNSGTSTQDVFNSATSLGVVPANTFKGLEIPGVSIPSFNGLVKDYAEAGKISPNVIQTLNNGKQITRGRSMHVSDPFKISPCALLTQPVSKLKDEIKGAYSAETFGGLGSANALGVKAVSITIDAEDQLGSGLFNATTSISRKINIVPEEPNNVNLSTLPWQSVFGEYPAPDNIPDAEFHRILLEKAREPATSEAANEILRALGRKSVTREKDINDQDPSLRADVYQEYRVRSWRLPLLEARFFPYQVLDSDLRFGDFALTTSKSKIHATAAVAAVAVRSNENATATANVRTGGYDIVIKHAVLIPNTP